jgi:hypothetical protein
MKRIIKESERFRGLFNQLPLFLKRRITLDDLEWIDRNLNHYVLRHKGTNLKQRVQFNDFSEYVIGELLHDFIMDRKADEIQTEIDALYGEVFNDESLDKIMDMYWQLMPIIIKRYEIKLHQAWEN